MTSSEERFISVLQELSDLYHKKNHDYGDSFRKSMMEFGFVSCVIRINDKTERLKSLVKNGIGEVKDETIRDTLLDLANYAIMSAMEL